MGKEFRVVELAEPISQYTDAVRYGDLLFVSGVAPVNENGQVVGGEDVVAQAHVRSLRTWGRSLRPRGRASTRFSK